MANRRTKKEQSPNRPATARPVNSAPAAVVPRLAGPKLWLFRLLAAVLAPVVCFGLAELALRLAGYGYPTAFMLPARNGETKILVQNNQFGWRFFGPQMSRRPHPFCISPKLDNETIRIFVLGESAAKGDPDPHFGLPRMLEATLSLRHPGVRFELVNAAMTAINSHAILPIARDCARVPGDVWVLYMGNNEVVGPFGAGTVFGPQTPPLPLIRGALALKATRTGQCLDALIGRARKSPGEGEEWGGMEMFFNQQVRADDPRMSGVYRHFERNLADLIRVGQRSGVGIVVSTVAVNLRDCAPFASEHSMGFSPAQKAEWDKFYQRGVEAQAAGRPAEAADFFRQAGTLDDSFAELRFRQGQCALARGDMAEARKHFQAACNLDTLRFRCDTRLNEVTRKAVVNREPERILLADAERAFADASAGGSPGEELFLEHVHLTFEGNWLLARTIGEQVEKLLAGRLSEQQSPARSWPTKTECARFLGWSNWSRRVAWKGILPRLRRPPFTGQLNHEKQLRRAEAVVANPSAATQAAEAREAVRACEEALATMPDDPALLAQLAVLKQATGDLAGAVEVARREVARLPSDSEGWSQLGLLLARSSQFPDAIAAFRRAVELDGQDLRSRESLAQSLAVAGRFEEASHEFRIVLVTKPNFGPAWLHFGEALEKAGRQKEAEDCFRKGLAARTQNLSALLELAAFCQRRGRFEEAVEKYREAINLAPTDARLRVGVGQNLSALKRYPEALKHATEAVRLEPTFAEALLLEGTILGQLGRVPEAAEKFREALKLKPDSVDARSNLGLALMTQGKFAEAQAEFEQALARDPTNAMALRCVQQMRSKP